MSEPDIPQLFEVQMADQRCPICDRLFPCTDGGTRCPDCQELPWHQALTHYHLNRIATALERMADQGLSI